MKLEVILNDINAAALLKAADTYTQAIVKIIQSEESDVQSFKEYLTDLKMIEGLCYYFINNHYDTDLLLQYDPYPNVIKFYWWLTPEQVIFHNMNKQKLIQSLQVRREFLLQIGRKQSFRENESKNIHH